MGRNRKTGQGRYNKLDMEDGFLYFKLKQVKDRLYLRCAVTNNVVCKASYVVCLENDIPNITTLKCIVPHNHPPDEMAVQTERFLEQLKMAVDVMDNYPIRKIYDIVADGYPELAKIYPYKVVARRMRYWEKLGKNKANIDYKE